MDSGKLEKLQIQMADNAGVPVGKPFDVMFNPNSYSISKSVSWGAASARKASGQKREDANTKYDAPMLEFGGGQSRSLSLELFYDVTEHPSVAKGKPIDVRELTNEIVNLTRIQRNTKPQRPPVVIVSWGKAGKKYDFPFTGVITQLSQRFTLFRRDGTPVRATLTVTFTEFNSPEKNKRETDPETTTRIIKRGDSLSSLAAELYGDPAQWRAIAEANRLDDPRQLRVGQRLTIP